MPASKRLLIGIAAAAVAVFWSATTLADDPADNTAQLEQKLDALEARVAALQARQNQDQAQQSSEIQQLVTQADAQSQLLDQMPSGLGYDSANGLHFASEDGTLYLHPWSLFQFQGIGGTTFNDQGLSSVQTNKNNTNTGFQIRHLEIGVDGHAITPLLAFKIQTESVLGMFVLEDAYINYKAGNSGWYFKLGQFEDPAWHESNVDDAHQLTMDRSLASTMLGGTIDQQSSSGPSLTPGFTPDRVQGAGVGYQDPAWRAEIDMHDGFESTNANFTGTPSPFVSAQNDFGLSARGEYKVIGDESAWNEYDQFSAQSAESRMLIVGTGGEWSEAEANDDFFYTTDIQFVDPCGFSAYGAFLSHFFEYDHTAHGADVGFLVQAGYMLNRNLEVFARYNLTALANHSFFNAGLAKPQGTVHEISAGMNWYLLGQQLKATVQGSVLPAGSPLAAPALGILADPRNVELVGAAQIQVLL